jgi:hypothetical protein
MSYAQAMSELEQAAPETAPGHTPMILRSELIAWQEEQVANGWTLWPCGETVVVEDVLTPPTTRSSPRASIEHP